MNVYLGPYVTFPHKLVPLTCKVHGCPTCIEERGVGSLYCWRCGGKLLTIEITKNEWQSYLLSKSMKAEGLRHSRIGTVDLWIPDVRTILERAVTWKVPAAKEVIKVPDPAQAREMTGWMYDTYRNQISFLESKYGEKPTLCWGLLILDR